MMVMGEGEDVMAVIRECNEFKFHLNGKSFFESFYYQASALNSQKDQIECKSQLLKH